MSFYAGLNSMNTSSIDSQINYIKKNFQKYDKILKKFQESDSNIEKKIPTKKKNIDSRNSIKKELKKELVKWKSKEKEILDQILELKSDMKKQLEKIANEKDKPKISKKENCIPHFKICENCSRLNPQLFQEMKLRQPNIPLSSDKKISSEVDDSKKKPEHSIDTFISFKTDDAATSTVKNLELDSIYGSKHFLRNKNIIEKNDLYVDNTVFTSRNIPTERENIKIDECFSSELMKNKRNHTFDCTTSARRRLFERRKEKAKNYMKGDIATNVDRCKTHDCGVSNTQGFFDYIGEYKINPTSNLPFDQNSEINFPKKEIKKVKRKTKYDSDSESDLEDLSREDIFTSDNEINYSYDSYHNKDYMKITPIEKMKTEIKPPTAYEIRFDFNKKNNDLTLSQAFKAHKSNLMKRIDSKKRITKMKQSKVKNKFHRKMNSRKKIGCVGNNTQNRSESINLKENKIKNNQSKIPFDISPDEAFKNYLEKKKRIPEKSVPIDLFESSKDLYVFSQSTFNQESSLNFFPSKENEQVESRILKEVYQDNDKVNNKKSRPISTNQNKRSRSKPKIRDLSLKQKIRKEYDQKVRQRNRQLLKPKTPKKINPYTLLKGFEKEISNLKKQLLNS